MNKKDRIMDLMRRGIISDDEAMELLKKAGLDGNVDDAVKSDKEKLTYTDKDGYVNHDVDFADAMKTTFQGVADKLAQGFKALSKTVDDNVDFTNGFPKVKSTSKIIEKDLEGEFSKVDLDLKAGQVEVYPGENAHVKVEYKIYGAIDEENLDEFLAEKTVLKVADDVLEISTSDSLRISADVKLYLPEKEYDKFDFNLTHGDIKFDKISVKDLELHQINGDVDLNATKHEKLELTTKNGKIRVVDGFVKDLNLDSINGDIRLTSEFESANVTLVNGVILLTQTTTTAKNLNVRNVNGDIKVAVPEALGLVGRVKTVFGGYKTRLKLDNPFEAGRNGAAVVRNGNETLTFELETKSGTIWLKDTDNSDEN